MPDSVFNKIKVSRRKGVVHNSVSLTLLVLAEQPGISGRYFIEGFVGSAYICVKLENLVCRWKTIESPGEALAREILVTAQSGAA